MAFNKENKISWDELAPSLQEMITGKATVEQYNEVKNAFDAIKLLSGGVRITVTSSLDNILSPVNNKELAIIITDSIITVYTYINSRWVKLHAVYA